METKKYSLLFNFNLVKVIHLEKILFILLFAFLSPKTNAATITSTSTGGTYSVGSSWIGGVAPTTTDDIIISNGATITLTAATTINNVTINFGGTLNIGTINAFTVTGNFINQGTFNGTTGRLYLTNSTRYFENTGNFVMGSGRIYLHGNATNFGTHTLTGTEIRILGTTNQSIAGFRTTGLVSMRKTGGIATFIGNVNGGGLTINGNNGTLNLGINLTHNFSGFITLSKGTLNGGSSVLNVSRIGTKAWTGTGSVFVAGTSTVTFNGLGNQIIDANTTNFNNVTFSGSGVKTLTTNRFTVNGILNIENTATVSAAPTYGANATLRYNTSIARNSGLEWVTPFSGTGGIVIANTGQITMNSAKVLNLNAPLTIDNGATLNTGNFQLTFGGNFTNNGTFNAGSSPIVITNTLANQTISGFSTTGLVTSTKTSGTATLLGNITSSGLTMNGNGGTLNLGNTLTHTINGTVTLTSGTLNGGSSNLNVTSTGASAWTGNGSLFSAGTCTVNFNGNGNQTINASATTFNNVTFSNSGVKSITTTNCIVNGVLTMEGTATVSNTPIYGVNSTLRYNTSINRTSGLEWITPFSGLGGVVVSNTGQITMNNAKVFNLNAPLNINNGATLNTGNFQLTFGGNFINDGTLIAGSSPIVITNTLANQYIGGFSTTGLVTFTKSSGTATLTQNITGLSLTMNGAGTLNLGSNLVHSFTTNITRTIGTINGNSSTLKLGGAFIGNGGTFTAANGTVDYNGTNQTVAALAYNNLVFSGSGIKTFIANTTVSGSLSIENGVMANLSNGLVHSTNGLLLNGVFQPSGTHGGTGSLAFYVNPTFFTNSTGIINNTCVAPVITIQPSNPNPVCSGNGIQTISVTAIGSNLKYLWNLNGVAISNNSVYSGQNTSTLTLTNPTVNYAGTYNVIITGACNLTTTSNNVTVVINPSPQITNQPVSTNLCQNSNGNITVQVIATNPTYQWQYSTNPISSWTNTNGLTDITGHTTNNLSFTNVSLSNNNRNFRCIITSNGCQTISNPALITVSSQPTVGTVSANQSICSASFVDNDLSISSASGTIQWQKASNATFTVGLQNIGTNSTLLTTTEIGILTATTYFRAVVSNGSCNSAISNTITVTIATTTWTSANGGSWSNGLPNNTKTAIIAHTFTSQGNGNGSFNACSLTVTNNAVVLIKDGDNIVLNGAINVSSGSFTLESNANLIQIQNVVNTGNISVKRKTNALKRLDYVMWSSPVTNQNLQSFSPSTLNNRFYTYNTSTNLYNTIMPSTSSFDVAKGYLIRVPNNFPTTPTIWTGTFTGVPRNGDYSVTITNEGAGKRFNAIGNPYPSTMSMEQFVADNVDNITGTLYFWRKSNSTVTSPGYCTWAGGTFVSNGETQVFDPQGIIQVGQGFIVEALNDATLVEFNNFQRVNDNANQTFRVATVEKNRMWLNLTGTNSEFYQMAVGYIDDATNGVDLFDGKYYNDGPISLNSIIQNNKYVIQGKALPFNDNDRIPLSLSVTNSGSYTISIDHLDGFFAEDQNIFIHDKLINVYHNLKTANYNFTSEAGLFDTRFEIVYKNPFTLNLQASNCDVVLEQISTPIYADLFSGAQGYRFKVIDITTNEVQTIDKSLRVFSLTQLASYAFDRTYSIEVAVKVNNVWQPFYGSACLVTTPSVTTQVQSGQCGITLDTLNEIIYADNVPFASGYRFKITNTSTLEIHEIERPIRDIRLTNIPVPQYNTTYTIEVAVRNTNGTYLPYGAVCNIITPDFPTTQVQNAQCNLETSLPLSTTLFADSFTGATTYRFRFVNGATTIQVDRPLRSIYLASVPGIQAGTVYSVSVALEINGTFGPFGKVCLVTTAGGARETEVVKPVSPFNAMAYPNPFAEHFKLNVTTSVDASIQVKVYDMLGKLVENRTVDTAVINEIEIGENYPAGVYNVIVSQGSEVKTLRVIKR